jgi:hypothetical protein
MSADLAAAIPAVADWRLATLPKALAPAQITQLLQSCNQNHPKYPTKSFLTQC